MGAVYLFSEALSAAQILAIYQLGPGYKVELIVQITAVYNTTSSRDNAGEGCGESRVISQCAGLILVTSVTVTYIMNSQISQVSDGLYMFHSSVCL